MNCNEENTNRDSEKYEVAATDRFHCIFHNTKLNDLLRELISNELYGLLAGPLLEIINKLWKVLHHHT